jgi:hypothetical protein
VVQARWTKQGYPDQLRATYDRHGRLEVLIETVASQERDDLFDALQTMVDQSVEYG